MQSITSAKGNFIHIVYFMAALEIIIKLFEAKEDQAPKWSDFVTTILLQYKINSIDDQYFCKSLQRVFEYEMFITIDRTDTVKYFKDIKEEILIKNEALKEIGQNIDKYQQIVKDQSLSTKIMYFLQKGLSENKQSQAILLALALITQHKQKKCEYFQRLSEQLPSCAYYLMSYANILQKRNYINEAIIAFNKVMNIFMKEGNGSHKLSSFALLVHGRFLAKFFQWQSAIQLYNKSFFFDPNVSILKSQIYAELVLQNFHFFRNYIDMFKKLKSQPIQLRAIIAIVQYHQNKKIGQQLFKAITFAIQRKQIREKEIYLYHYCFGIKKFEQVQFGLAYDYLRLSNRDQESQIALIRLERCCFRMGNYEQALEITQKLFSFYHKKPYHLAALNLICLGQYEKAKRIAETIERFIDIDQKATLGLLQIYSKLGCSNKVIISSNEITRNAQTYHFLYIIQIQILLFINHEKIGNKKQAELPFETAYRLILQKNLDQYYFQQFQQTSFIARICFERNLLQKGRRLVKKMKKIIDLLRKYSLIGAKLLHVQLRQKKQFDIETLFHY